MFIIRTSAVATSSQAVSPVSMVGLSVVDDTQVERAVEAIQKAAHTGKIGDGKIFVTPVEQALRIRTGETGSNAL